MSPWIEGLAFAYLAFGCRLAWVFPKGSLGRWERLGVAILWGGMVPVAFLVCWGRERRR